MQSKMVRSNLLARHASASSCQRTTMTKDPQTTQSEPAPPGSGLVKFLAWLIGPAGLVIVAPWFMPILGLGLFPDYFDPLPKVGADLAFFVSFLVGMGWYRRVKYEDMKWRISRTCV